VPSVSDLGVWKTPCERAPRLAERLGLGAGDLWIKRDDWLGLGGGGNKLRKLEHLCGEAVAAGATTLVTTGAAQSNYARLTAASARRLGLDVVLVLHAGTGTGNLTLNAVFGAEIVWDGDAEAIAASRPGAVVLPYGGSSAVGARGYVTCAREIEEQVPDARHVVVGVGSGGTMAGLVAGLGADRVLGVDTGAVSDPVERVSAFVEELGASAEGLRMRLDQVGPGYEELSDAARRAIDDAGRCEGLVLDPVYTAKAMAGLAAAVAGGEIKPGERTVFVHTGGLPGLFGHPYAAELTARVV
jgi:1-aminocyclopropane-1-carboxylate deaminase/D-cysteine desulfhydrase-like pyridoxal-dependent ACC family enzyme